MTMPRSNSDSDALAPLSGTAPGSSAASAAAGAQAASWLVRRQAGLSESDSAAFEHWLGHSAVHRAAYDEVCAAWQALDLIPTQQVERLRAGIARLDADDARREAPAAVSLARRSLLPRIALAGTALALTGAGLIEWRRWQSMPVFANGYRTGRGQFLTVRLGDGSVLQLDTETQLEVRLFRHRREVRLLGGQAMFTVAADPNRPFEVLARAVTVTVVGTRFAVRCTQTGLEHDNVRVEVEEGRVRVGSLPAVGGSRTAVELVAGQTVATDRDGRLRANATVSPTRVAAWRGGRLTFENTTLLSAVQEFERYEVTNVAINDASVAAMRLTGSFEIGQATRFVRALPRVLPVRVRRQGDTFEIVRAG